MICANRNDRCAVINIFTVLMFLYMIFLLRPPNFIPETPVIARTMANKAKSYPATDLSFVPESQSSPLPGSVLRHLDNR